MSTSPQNPTLSEFWANTCDLFKETLRNEGSAPTTQASYQQHAKRFLAWMLGRGLTPEKLPPEVPEAYYTEQGWGPGNSYRNLTTCALRAFIRFARNNGINFPELTFPASIAPPRRKKKDPPPPTEEPEMPETTVPNAFLGDVAPPSDASTTIVADQTKVIATPPASPADSIPAYHPPVPEMAPTEVPPPPSNLSSMARPRTVDKRQTSARNPLGSLLPAGGTLRVYRVSDGTDGAGIGSRVPVNDFTETDLRGFKDIAVFIKEVVYAMQDPLTRIATVTYVVEQWDDQGRMVPPPRRVQLPNTRFGSNAGSHEMVTSDPAAGGPVGALIASFVRRMDEFQTWQMEREKAREEAARGAGPDPLKMDQASWAAMVLDSKWRTPPIDVHALVSDTLAKIKEVTSMSPMTGANGQQVPVTVHTEDGRTVLGLLEKSMDKITEMRTAPVIPTAPVTDPIATAIKLHETFGQKGPDPAVVELREQNKQLRVQLDGITQQMNTPKPTPGLMSQIKELEELDSFIARRTGGGSSDLTSALTTLFEKLPEVVDSIAKLKAGTTVQAPNIAEARAAAAKKTQAPPTPTDAMNEAFATLATATDDQGIVNGLTAVINAIATAPKPWPNMLGQLDKAFKEVETVDELSNLVLELIGACQQRGLLRKAPGVARRVTDALARNFDVVCQTIGHPSRTLSGVEVPAENETEEETESEAETEAPETPEAKSS